MKTFAIINADGKSFDFNYALNSIKREFSPFKEIINHEDYSDYSIVINSLGETIPLKDTFQLSINVNDVGVFHMLFKQSLFKKEKIVPAVLDLKEVEVTNIESARTKSKLLADIAKRSDPLLVIYEPKGRFTLDNSSIMDLHYVCTTFILPIEEKSTIDPKKIKAKSKEDNKDFKEDKRPNNFWGIIWAAIKAFFRPIKKDKFNFVFALLASFIIGFTCGTGIYNAFGGKSIAVFFFICCAAGAVLNGFVYGDLFNEAGIKSMKYVTTVVTSFVGLGIATIGSKIFFDMQTSVPEGFPSLGKVYATFLLVATAIILVSMFSSLLVRLIIKPKPKKESK